ncbi:MAG: hypothetical protein MUE94_07770 [Verrucomicrobia bacterium]|jgi:hypothetical protein|nr:hypothetical protein [Verrucomicrobiota bacterium]
MNDKLLLGLLALTGFTVGLVQSAEPEPAAPMNRNRFSLSFDAGFNVQAEFRNRAPDVAPPPASGSGLAGDPVDRNYDDGYNRVDFFNNGGGLTWNWGYEQPSQYDDNTTISLHATSRSGYGASTGGTDDPQLGLELKYGRVLGKLGKNKPWGLEGSLSYLNLSIKDSSPMASVQRVTDRYDTGLPLLPQYVNPPYQGTFNGPGPLLDDLPTRSVETAGLSGWNELSGSLLALRLGPFLEIPLSSRFVSQFGLGLSLLYADTEYSYEETATFSDGSTLTDSDSASSSDVLVGAYVEGQVGYRLTENWSLFGGVRVDTATDLTVTAGNRESKLDLGGTWHALVGVGCSF